MLEARRSREPAASWSATQITALAGRVGIAARFAGRLPADRRQRRVRSLASSTLGWSNGSIPRTARRSPSRPPSGPSRPRCRSGRRADPDHRVAGRGKRLGSTDRDAVTPSPASERHEHPIGPVGSRVARRLLIGRHDAHAVLAGRLGDGARSAHAPKLAIGSSARIVELVAPGAGEAAHDQPEPGPGVRGRVRLAAQAEHRLARGEERIEVEPDQRGRHEPDVGEGRVAPADVGQVQELPAQIVVMRIDAMLLPGSEIATKNSPGFWSCSPRSSRAAAASPTRRPGTPGAPSLCPTCSRRSTAFPADRDRRPSPPPPPGPSGRGRAARGSPRSCRRVRWKTSGARLEPPMPMTTALSSPPRSRRRRSPRGPGSGA